MEEELALLDFDFEKQHNKPVPNGMNCWVESQ